MCNPSLIVPLALGAAGAGVNAYETNRTQKAMTGARNAATMAELERQRNFQANSQKVFGDTLNKFTPGAQDTTLATEQNRVADAFKSNAPSQAALGSISSGNAPTIVKTNEDSALADAFLKGQTADANLGKLAGWDQRAFTNKMNLGQGGRELDINSDLARTSAAVGGLEQDAAAKNAFRPNSGFGDLLQFAGNVAGYQAGKGKTFTSIFGAPAPTASMTNPALLSGRGLY